MNKYYTEITTNTILPINIPVTYAYICDNRSDKENWRLTNSPSNAALYLGVQRDRGGLDTSRNSRCEKDTSRLILPSTMHFRGTGWNPLQVPSSTSEQDQVKTRPMIYYYTNHLEQQVLMGTLDWIQGCLLTWLEVNHILIFTLTSNWYLVFPLIMNAGKKPQ